MCFFIGNIIISKFFKNYINKILSLCVSFYTFTPSQWFMFFIKYFNITSCLNPILWRKSVISILIQFNFHFNRIILQFQEESQKFYGKYTPRLTLDFICWINLNILILIHLTLTTSENSYLKIYFNQKWLPS